MSTEFMEVSNTYSPGYYEEGYPDDPYSSGTIAGRGQMTNIVVGALADRVLARVGKSEGVVTIVEDHWDIGYCVTCSDEMVDFEVRVDDEQVWRSQYWGGGSAVYGPETVNSIEEFNEWLDQE